jgi:hypothetical protein
VRRPLWGALWMLGWIFERRAIFAPVFGAAADCDRVLCQWRGLVVRVGHVWIVFQAIGGYVWLCVCKVGYQSVPAGDDLSLGPAGLWGEWDHLCTRIGVAGWVWAEGLEKKTEFECFGGVFYS